MAEASARVQLAQKQLAYCYSSLVLGLGLSQEHHMACGRSDTGKGVGRELWKERRRRRGEGGSSCTEKEGIRAPNENREK